MIFNIVSMLTRKKYPKLVKTIDRIKEAKELLNRKMLGQRKYDYGQL